MRDVFYDLFADAVAAEEWGNKFYVRANEISNSALAKVVLIGLAEDELKHKVAIGRFCKKKNVMPKSVASEVFRLPVRDLRRQITAFTPVDQVIKFALKFERQGYNYYSKLRSKTKDKKALKLLDFLIGQENAHYKLLSGTLAYLTKPAEWFAQEEKPIAEG
ncbi:MAG: ferritin family protein [Candidatus Omnitrophota bacterium]